jgi:hypothetical protein
VTRPHTRVLRRLSWFVAWSAPLLFGGLAFGQNGALHITEPTPGKNGTIVTHEPEISLKGTLSWKGGDRRVMWESSRGFSDLAAVHLADDRKTILWSSSVPVPLRAGINHIEIKALGQPGAATFVNVFYTPRSPEQPPVLKTTILHGKQITYEVRDGFAIYQSDMILGKAADMDAVAATLPPAAKNAKAPRPEGLTITPNFLSSTGLWPVVNGVVRVPYTITNVNTTNTNNINAAIAESNAQLAGVVQWEPATASDVNYVNFDFDPSNFSGACEALEGMVGGGPQPIGGSINCTTTTILHEMGHALGLYHEQSRADRDNYVNYMEQNIDKPNHGNFDIIGSSSVGSGYYNYASIMEYGPFSFNKDGVSPTLETIPPGMVLGVTVPGQYTSCDLDAIMRLYAHAPTSITVDTNPTGFEVIVDGTTCTAPCVFTTWTSGSQHTLSVPSANQTLQTLNGQNYIFGRWNAVQTGNVTEQTVIVTNSLGNGTLLSPSTAPAITNYLASFIPIHPYSPVIYPSGDGTITSSPPPSSIMIDGSPTNYFIDRQLVTITVNPTAAGYSFYDWYQVSLFNYYTNPFTFYITTNFDFYNFDTGDPVTAVLVPDTVTTTAAASPDLTAAGLGIFPGFAIGVTDGNGNVSTAYTPENFDAFYDGSGFAAGKKLTFSTAAATTQSPVTTNISYQFGNWTGAGAPSGNNLSVTVPASGHSTSTANFTPSFRSLVSTYLFCPDVSGNNELNVTSTPGGTNVDSYDTYDGDLDAFFTSGTVMFSAGTGTSGLSMVGWSLDLAAGGTSSPYSYPLTGQTLGTANFNISGAAPLTITSVSPVTVASGTVYITVTGTGFSTNAANLYTYYVDPVTGYWLYRANTPSPAGSSTQTVVQLSPGDVATAGYYQIVVLNAVTSGCNPSIVFTFPVANSAGPPVLGISKTNVGNFNQGQQNAHYTILVSNIGTGTTVDPVTVTEAVPAGETLVSMSGSGWNCSVSPTCTQISALAAGMSYGAITVTVNVAANASSPQVNSATVSGGGAASATATDSTTIIAVVPVPNVVGDTQAAATTAITGASLVVGTVTPATSGTVPSGDVISESPVSGTMVAAGSAVNLVVSVGPTSTASIVSVTPNPATGLSNTFVLTYSDTAGYASLNHVGVIFGPAASASGSCYVVYYPAANLVYLLTNAGAATNKITPGSGTISNSQCTVSGSGTSVVKSGDNLTLNLAVTASSTYTGKQTVFLYAGDNNATNTGWVSKGTWTPAANQAPTVVSVTPTPATGLTNSFALTYSDPNGNTDLAVVGIDFGPAVSTSNSCYVLYYPATNALSLVNNAGTATTKITLGSGTLSNSQCTISGSGSTVVKAAGSDQLTLNLAVTASSTYTGKQGIFMYAQDDSAAKTAWVNEGTWTPAANQAPTVVSVTPTPATGLTNTFALTYSDPNGASDLDLVEVDFGSTVSSTNSCFVLYYPATNSIELLTNAGGASSKITPGSGTLSNSQCTISGSGTTVVRSGDNLTLNLAVTASATYTGAKNIYLFAEDNSAVKTTYVNKGTWTP